jgi:cytochrome c oxidase assembly protein subunit 15
MQRLRVYQRLVGGTAFLCFALIMIGAWVRLTDAGLGCPDWPGCYGKLTPIQAQAEIAEAVAEQGGEHGPVSLGKAWREMIHRYIATGLGLLILVISALAWRWKRDLGQSPYLATATVGVVVMQGLFGMWTVTLLLKPAIVTIHLLGGLLTFSMLFWLWLRTWHSLSRDSGGPLSATNAGGSVGSFGVLAIAAVTMQIALGGWTSTNYAALACPDFPMCQGSWAPPVNFADAFHVIRELGKTAQGSMIDLPALTAIHLSHRLGAVMVLLIVGLLGWRCLNQPPLRAAARLLFAMLLLQWCLGISNVVFDLPLWVAVAHTGGAVVLLALVLLINFLGFVKSIPCKTIARRESVLTGIRKFPDAIG